MTVGSFTNGASFSSSYESKTWNGADGKFYTDQFGFLTEKFNPYSMSAARQTLTPSDKGHYCGSLAPFPSGTYDEAAFQAETKLTEAIKEHSFNLAISFAEGKQVVDMTTSTIHKLGNCIRALTRWNLEGACRALGFNFRRSLTGLRHGDVQSAWLELQYGWLPLLSDVEAAATAFAKHCNRTRRSRVRVSAYTPFSYNASQSPPNWSCIYECKRQVSIIYIMTEEISANRELGLTDPLSVIWEKIPYSFVFDWFLPVGDYLANLNVIPSLKGTFIVTKKILGSGEIHPINDHYYHGAGGHSERVVLKRTVTSALSPTLPTFVSIPDAMSPTRITNAIALATQGWGRYR